jgi:hypothetical protein
MIFLNENHPRNVEKEKDDIDDLDSEDEDAEKAR